MKLFSFTGYVLAISAVFWIIDASINTLDHKCEAEQPSFVEQVKIVILGFIGKPPPEAPWWRPLCHITTPDLTKNLNALFSYIIFCMVVIFLFGSAEIRNPLRRRKSPTRKVVKNVYKVGLSERHDADITPKHPTETVSLTATNSVVSKRATLKITTPPKPALLYLFWSMKDIVFQDPVIPNSVKQRCFPSAIFGDRTPQQKPLDTLLNSMNRQFKKGNNMNNHRQTIVEEKLEEINQSSTNLHQEGRYDKVLLGPVAGCLQALIKVVAATFLSYGIQNSATKWSTERDLYGGPGKIRATSSSMMAEICVSEFTIYRVTGVQGLLRSVSYKTYLVTYNGLVCTEESTTCMCGPGWNL